MTLAILPNWLGDLVMVEPALRALRARGPLTAVVAPGLAALVEDARIVDHIAVFDRRGRDRGPGGLWRAGRRLRGAGEVYVFGPSLRAAALAAATGAARRVGLGGAGRGLFLTETHAEVRPARSRHLAEQWRALVADAADGRVRCAWTVGEQGARGLAALRRSEPRLAAPYVAFGAGANFGVTKEWPPRRFVDVARALRRARGLQAVFIGSANESERRRIADLAVRTDGVDLAGRTDLPTLAAVLGAASAFVGNDSGPMHLAAALGVPTVGIFGSTSPTWTGPLGARARCVGPAPVPCTPCFRRTCPFDRECLLGIESGPVVAALLELMEGIDR